MTEYPKFSDFAENETGPLEGEKKKIDDILNQEILVIGHRTQESQYKKNKSGKYLTLQFIFDTSLESKYVIFTGSDILINQMDKYKEKVPFWTTIKKNNKFYTFA